MEIGEIIQAVFQYGGTVIMAVLFVWVFIQDKTKNSVLLESNTEMLRNTTKLLEALTESNKNIAEGNINIAKSLDIISNNLLTMDKKIDRNYEVEVKKKGD